MVDKIKDYIIKGIERLFELDKHYFNEIIIKDEVIEDIMEFANANYPREFVAFFHGVIKDNKLMLDSLVYNEYNSNEGSATPIFHFPDKSFFGSVHSHPSGSSRPSRADIFFFRKTGIVHAIIGYPYTKEKLRFYDNEGNELNVKIE